VDYLPRIVDRELGELLSAAGAVVIDGPKACGKTETARQHAASEVLLDVDATAADAVAVDPALLLEGAAPRLLDEWQTHPVLWNHVRREVDARRRPGQFILTGSATPIDDHTRHSGAGRLARVRMRPMTLFELDRSSGAISLADLLAGGRARSTQAEFTLDDLVGEVVRGGWPGLRLLAPDRASRLIAAYLDQISRTDIVGLGRVRRDPARLTAVIESLARNVATQATLTSIAKDASGRGMPVSDDTAGEYHEALERLMVVEDLPAWNTHLRSRHRLRTRPTRHFVDPSLAVAALGGSAVTVKRDLRALGLLFESLAVRDLRVYAQALGGSLFHYRDESGLEVDAIVDAGETWGAFEIKLGTGQIDAAAESLLRFAERVDTSVRGEPAVLGVIVASGLGYVRKDGVNVVPISSLGP
jgi:predicted AAA+ superfamily ATPase